MVGGRPADGGGEFNKFPLSLRGAFNNTINPGGTGDLETTKYL